jgi:hypothetical protein
VYNIAAGRTIPRWLDDKQKKSMRRDDDYRKRVEILQASPLLPPRSTDLSDGQRRVGALASTGMKLSPAAPYVERRVLPVPCGCGAHVYSRGECGPPSARAQAPQRRWRREDEPGCHSAAGKEVDSLAWRSPDRPRES